MTEAGNIFLAVALIAVIVALEWMRGRRQKLIIGREINSIATGVNDKNITIGVIKNLSDRLNRLKNHRDIDKDDYAAILSLETRLVGLKKYHYNV